MRKGGSRAGFFDGGLTMIAPHIREHMVISRGSRREEWNHGLREGE